MIKYAFKNLKASQLFAGHNPNNEPSKHLLNKLGFHYTHDEYYPQPALNIYPIYSKPRSMNQTNNAMLWDIT